MSNNKFLLYALVIIGHVFIFGSLINLASNFKKQKQLSVDHFNNHILDHIAKFESELQFNNIYLINFSNYLANTPEISKALNDEKNSALSPISSQKNIAVIDAAFLIDSSLNIIAKAFGKPSNFESYIDENTINLIHLAFKTSQTKSDIQIKENSISFLNYTICKPLIINDNIKGAIILKRNINSWHDLMTDDYIERFNMYLTKVDNTSKSELFQFPNFNEQDSISLINSSFSNPNPKIKGDSLNHQIILKRITVQINNKPYNLDFLIISKNELIQLESSFNLIIISYILLVIGLLLLFFVIYRSRIDYHRLKKENKNLNTIAVDERKYKNLFEYSPLPIGIYHNKKIVLLNKAGLDLFEIDNEVELNKIQVFDLLHPDYKKLVAHTLEKILSGNNAFETKIIKFISLKNNELTAEVSGYLTEYNNEPAVQIMINNVTERFEFLQKIKESEIKYKTIFEQLTDAVMLIKDDYFIDCNDAATKIFGFNEREDIIQMHPGELSPPYQSDGEESSIKASRMIQECMDKGFNRFEWQHKKVDGTVFWMDIILTRIILNEEYYIHVIGRDISEFKEVYDQLEASKKYLNNLLKRLPIPIVIYSLPNKITFTNDSFIDTYGYTKDELLNIDDWWNLSIKDPRKRYEIRENWEKAIQNIIKESTVIQQQWTIYDKNENAHDCEFYGIKTENIVIVVLNDITEIKNINQNLLIAREKSEDSNRLKSAFLANLSHELRTPMNGILGFSQLLGFPDLDDEERQSYVDLIQKSGTRLLNMINDIISISKIDAGQIDMNIQKFKLQPILNEIIEFHKVEAIEKGLEYKIDFQEFNDNIIVNTDEFKLKQILSNLIGNAIKYTPKGEIQIKAEADSDIKIYIKDSGYGIKSENLNKIFERFIRLEETNNKTDGTGLGLSISKAYADQLGLKIEVKSEFGQGSEFCLIIPIKDKSLNTNIEPDKKEESKVKEIPQMNQKTILIAEDDELNFMILKLYLEKTKAKILRAENGKIATEMVLNQNIDMIFMDIKMPVMDGIEAMKIIKSSHPNIPIFAQTAFTFSEDKEKCLEAGFDKYLSKPLNREDVYDVLRAI